MNLTKASRLTRDRSSRRRHAIQPNNNPIKSPKTSGSGKRLGLKGRKVSKTVNDKICEENMFYPTTGEGNGDVNKNRAIENSEYNDKDDEYNDKKENAEIDNNCDIAAGNDKDNEELTESLSIHFERCNNNEDDDDYGRSECRKTVNFDDDDIYDGCNGNNQCYSDKNNNLNHSNKNTGSRHPYPARYHQRNSLPIINGNNSNSNNCITEIDQTGDDNQLCNGFSLSPQHTSQQQQQPPPSYQQTQNHQDGCNNNSAHNTPTRHQHRYQNQSSMPATRSSSFTQQQNNKYDTKTRRAAFRTRSISEHRPPPPNHFRSPVSVRRRNVIHCDELLQYQPKRLTAVEQKLRRKMTFVPSFHTASSVSEAVEEDISSSENSLFKRAGNKDSEAGRGKQQFGATPTTTAFSTSASGSTTAAGTPRPPWMIKAALSRSVSPISESAIILS